MNPASTPCHGHEVSARDLNINVLDHDWISRIFYLIISKMTFSAVYGPSRPRPLRGSDSRRQIGTDPFRLFYPRSTMRYMRPRIRSMTRPL
jgi:hypothetical protein